MQRDAAASAEAAGGVASSSPQSSRAPPVAAAPSSLPPSGGARPAGSLGAGKGGAASRRRRVLESDDEDAATTAARTSLAAASAGAADGGSSSVSTSGAATSVQKRSRLLSESDDDVVIGGVFVAPTPTASSGEAAATALAPTCNAKAAAAQQPRAAAGTGGAKSNYNNPTGAGANGGASKVNKAPRKRAPVEDAQTGSSSSSDSGSSSSEGSSESSSDSSDSSESDSNSDSDSRRRRSSGKRGDANKVSRSVKAASGQQQKEGGASGRRRAAAATARTKKSGSDDEEGEDAQIKMGTFDPRNRNNKERLIAQFLRRWWFAWPDWPPADFDYTPALEARRLKWVELEEYEDLDDVDSQGFTKVYQISAFPGVFRDPQGNAIDLRPKEGRPCFANAKELSELELLRLIVKAITNQLEKLKESPFDETATRIGLLNELEEAKTELASAERKHLAITDVPSAKTSADAGRRGRACALSRGARRLEGSFVSSKMSGAEEEEDAGRPPTAAKLSASRGGRVAGLSRTGVPLVAALLQRAASDKAEAARILRNAPRLDRVASRSERQQSCLDDSPPVKGPRKPRGLLAQLASQRPNAKDGDEGEAAAEVEVEAVGDFPRREGGVAKGRGLLEAAADSASAKLDGSSQSLRGFAPFNAEKAKKREKPADASTAITATTQVYKAKAHTKGEQRLTTAFALRRPFLPRTQSLTQGESAVSRACWTACVSVVCRNLPRGLGLDLLAEVMPPELRSALTWHWELPRRERDAGADWPAAIFLNFKTQTDAEAFCRLFNTRGIEGFDRGVAVLAPYQKIAKERSQPDKREGTIFNGRWLADLDYLEFCKDIGNPPESAASAESLQKASEAASQ